MRSTRHTKWGLPLLVIISSVVVGRELGQGSMNIPGGLVLCGALGLSALASPAIGIVLLVSVLLNNLLVDAILPLPLLLSPFYVLAAALMLVSIARLALRQVSIQFDPQLGMPLLGFGAWIALYALADFGPHPVEAFVTFALPLSLFIVGLVLIRSRSVAIWTVGGLLFSFVLLSLTLLPSMLTGAQQWGGFLRSATTGPVSATRSATAVDWLFNIAAALTLGFAISTGGAWRRAALMLFGLFTVTSLLTYTRGSVVGLFSSVFALLILQLYQRNQRRAMLVSFLGIIVLVGLYYSPMWEYLTVGKSFQRELLEVGRSRLWFVIEGVRGILSSPLWGNGAGGSPTHSFVLDQPFQYGIPASLLFFYVIFCLLRRSWRLVTSTDLLGRSSLDRAILVGCYTAFTTAIMQAVFDPTLTTTAYAIIFWMLRAVEAFYWRQETAPTPIAADVPSATSSHRPLVERFA